MRMPKWERDLQLLELGVCDTESETSSGYTVEYAITCPNTLPLSPKVVDSRPGAGCACTPTRCHARSPNGSALGYSALRSGYSYTSSNIEEVCRGGRAVLVRVPGQMGGCDRAPLASLLLSR